jgi:hypothetical protein
VGGRLEIVKIGKFNTSTQEKKVYPMNGLVKLLQPTYFVVLTHISMQKIDISYSAGDLNVIFDTSV